jgi:GDP-L-fucose synthase
MKMANTQPSIYIAGHRGMVGSAIVRQLLAAGHAPDSIITRTHAELDLVQAKQHGYSVSVE